MLNHPRVDGFTLSTFRQRLRPPTMSSSALTEFVTASAAPGQPPAVATTQAGLMQLSSGALSGASPANRAAARAAAARAGLAPAPAGAPAVAKNKVSAFVKKQREDPLFFKSLVTSFNEIDHSDDDALDFNEFIKIVPEPLRAQASPRTLKESH